MLLCCLLSSAFGGLKRLAMVKAYVALNECCAGCSGKRMKHLLIDIDKIVMEHAQNVASSFLQ